MVPNILLIRLLAPNPLFFWAYVLPFIYWAYLVLTTNFVIVFDSEDYVRLANILYHPSNWAEYFRIGPSREPLYPLIIAFSLHLGHWLNISYEYVLRTVSFLLLALTMVFIHLSLRKINARPWIQALAILYTGLSPILINSALCVYSEIATFPFLVAAVFFGWLFMDSLQEMNGPLYPSCGLALSLLAFTMVKGLGEGLAPLFLFCLIVYSWKKCGGGFLQFLKRSKIKILIIVLILYIPLIGFRLLNYSFNNHFTFTSRADVNLFGNLMRRSHVPLNVTNFMSHLLTIPVSHDLCGSYYPDSVCSQWSMINSDGTFYTRQNQLNQLNLSESQKNKIYVHEITQDLLTNPLAQSTYFIQEGFKMFFWETTQGPFVIYPQWLEKFLNQRWLALSMCFGIGFICLIAYLKSFTMLNNKLILLTITLLSLLIFLYSFFHIIHRYATIAGPLLILLTFACIDGIIKSRAKP